MSSRKRKNSPIPIAENSISNKRAKLLSNLWAPQEDTGGTTRSIGRSKSTSCNSRGVIQGKPKQHLVNWQAPQGHPFSRGNNRSSFVSGPNLQALGCLRA